MKLVHPLALITASAVFILAHSVQTFYHDFYIPSSQNASASIMSMPMACKVYLPNAFSPNDDGRNDIFQPETACAVSDYNLKIFNRWGNLLFESTDIDVGWDGKYKGSPVEQDVFVYQLTYVLSDGDNEPLKEVVAGEIALLR